MNEKELEWAYERVEAMADGTLSSDERRRMHEAMARHAALAAAVARAQTLRSALRGLRAEPVPAGLLSRLLRVPFEQEGAARGRSAGTRDGSAAKRGRGGAHGASGASAGSATHALPRRAWIALPVAAALAVAVVLVVNRTPPEDDARAAAIRDFGVAMAYLQKSAAHASEEVGGIVSTGIYGAVLAGRESIQEKNAENGG